MFPFIEVVYLSALSGEQMATPFLIVKGKKLVRDLHGGSSYSLQKGIGVPEPHQANPLADSSNSVSR